MDAVRLGRTVGKPAAAARRGARPRGQEGLCHRLHLPPLGGQAGQSPAARPAAGLLQGERCARECERSIRCWVHAAAPGRHARTHAGGSPSQLQYILFLTRLVEKMRIAIACNLIQNRVH